MVEQEHSKNSTAFSAALISNNGSQNCASNAWLTSDATSQIKSEELCSSEFFNNELLYGSVLSADDTLCSPDLNANKERDSILFQETLPNDIFSTNASISCDLYYDDKTISSVKDYWHPMSEKFSSVSDLYFEANSPPSFWGNCPLDIETLKMDDVFQVDKDDLVQSPTLAELNANDESLFDSFDNFYIPLPAEQKSAKSSLLEPLNTTSVYRMPSLTETSQINTKTDLSERTNILLNLDESCGKVDSVSDNGVRSGISVKENKTDSASSDSVIKSEEFNANRKVISKLVKKPYPVNESTIETTERKKCKNVPEVSLPTNPETFDSEEEDSEMDCDYSSDVDEESEEETKVHSSKQVAANNLLLQKKKSRYFWQYNIQSKGPKAPKMKLDGKSSITDNFPGISDPVFTSNYLSKGIKHAGKARRGDGNDLTPNPQKLYNIGLELEKLTSVIEGLIPANELPLNARSKSRKEKNKLASRACRLKKKAQHEANKLKLYGLQKEQKHLQNVIVEVKKIIRKGIENMKHGKVQSIHAKIESLCMKKCFTEVAGCSAEFVNNILKNVDLGDKSGGLDIEAYDE